MKSARPARWSARIGLITIALASAGALITCGGGPRRGGGGGGSGGDGGDQGGGGGSGQGGGGGSGQGGGDGSDQGGSGGGSSCATPGSCPNGAPCSAPLECQSGVCADGVCCDMACDGVCEACDQPGSAGSCAPSPAATDPESECTTAGSVIGACNGAAACSGKHLWSRRFGGPEQDDGHAVTLSPSGDAFIVGRFRAAADFGGALLQSSGDNDIVLAKYSGVNGDHLWSKPLGGPADDLAYSIAADGGGVFLAGFYWGDVDFGGGYLLSAGGYDVVLARYDGATGDHLWSKRLGGVGDDHARSVALDNSGDIIISGFFQDAVDFGGGALQSANLADVFVAKYSGATGGHVWSKRFGGSTSESGVSVAVDAAGDVLVVGTFGGDANFGGAVLQNKGGLDIFLAKYDGATGGHLWSRAMGGSGGDLPSSVAIDAAGDVFIGGFYSATMDLGGGALPSAGGYDVFVAKYEGSSGDHVWSRRFGGVNNDVTGSVVVDAGGSVVVTGTFHGDADFGGGVLKGGFLDDMFLAKYEGAAGAHVFSRILGGSESDDGTWIATDSGGNLFVTGSMRGAADFGGGVLQSAGVEDVVLIKLAP